MLLQLVPELKLASVASTAAPELCHRHVADLLSQVWLTRPLFTDFETTYELSHLTPNNTTKKYR